MIAWKRKKHLHIADDLSTMQQLNTSQSTVPVAVSSRAGTTNAVIHSKHNKDVVTLCSQYRENGGSITVASTLRGTTLHPSKPGCKSSSEISPSTTACGDDMPSATLQHFPIVLSCSARGETVKGSQSEESKNARTSPNPNISPSPPVLSECYVAMVRNSPAEQHRDVSMGNNGFNSEHDSQSKPEDITPIKALRMKHSTQPQTKTPTTCNKTQSFNIPNIAPRIDIPEVAVESGDEQQTVCNAIPWQSRQGLQVSTSSGSICSIVTGADDSSDVSKTARNISLPTSEEKGQVSIAISKYRTAESARSGIFTSKSGDQVSLSGKKGSQGKNDEMTFMSEYERYVSEGKGLCMTKHFKSLNSKILMDYPDIKAALERKNLMYNEQSHSAHGREEPSYPVPEPNYGSAADEVTTAPPAATLMKMVEKRLVIPPGTPVANGDSGENPTAKVNPSLDSHVKVVDTNSTGITRALGLIHVSNLQHQSVHSQSMSFPQLSPAVQYSSPIDIVKSHMNRRELWEKQANRNSGMCDSLKSSKDVPLLNMSTGVSASPVQTGIQGRGRSRGSRTRGGGRRSRGKRRVDSTRSYISKGEKSKDQDHGGRESLNPIQTDDTCSQPKRRGSRTRIRGGGRGTGRRCGSLNKHTNPAVDIAGSRVNEGASSRGLRGGDITSENSNTYVDLTKGDQHSVGKPAQNIRELNDPFTLRSDGIAKGSQDASSSTLGAGMPGTTAGLAVHSTLKSLINQPSLQPIRPCSREIEAQLLGTGSSLSKQPVKHHINQYLPQRRLPSLLDNDLFNQSSAQHMPVSQPLTALTIANVLTLDRSQNEGKSVNLLTQSTPDLSNVLSCNRQRPSLQSTRAKLGQYLNNEKTGESTVSDSSALQTNMIDLTEDGATLAATNDGTMNPSQPSVRVPQEPMCRKSCPETPPTIPVPVCQMSKDTTSKENSLAVKATPLLQAPVLMPQDMFSPTINHSPVIRPLRARSTAAMQSPTVVSLLNRAPVPPSSIRAPPRHLSPAHQVQPKETLRLTRMMTPPAAHTPRNPSDILIEPAPPDISPIHVEMIYQRNGANLPNTSSVKQRNSSIMNTVSTSCSTNSRSVCSHGDKCMCVRSNASSPDVQILEGPLPSTSSSTGHHPQAVSKPGQSEILQASNLTVQRKTNTHSKPASITNEPMHKKRFGTVSKDKGMTTCAHHILDRPTHGMRFPHCAHTSACPKVTLQQKCCQHLSGVPPPAHAKVPIEILQTTPLDLTAVPPPVIEAGLDLSIIDKEIPRHSTKKQNDQETSETVKTNSGSLSIKQAPSISASTISFQHANYSTTSLESKNQNNTGTLTVNHTASFSVNDTVVQTSIIPTQLNPNNGDKSQPCSSQHYEQSAGVEESNEKGKEVAAPKNHDNRFVQQREAEDTGLKKPDSTPKFDPVYDLKKKSNIVQEGEQVRLNQKQSTQVDITKISKNLAKLAEREEQIKGKRNVFRKQNKQKHDADPNSRSVTPVETTQETSLLSVDGLTHIANNSTGQETSGITVKTNSTATVTTTFRRKPVSLRQERSLNNSRKKKNPVVKAQKKTSNPSKPKQRNKNSVSLQLDTNSDLTEFQTSRPKRAAVTSGGYKKECACSACINYDVPKRRRSKESASGNSTPSTPSTPPVQQVPLSMFNSCEIRSSKGSTPFDSIKQVLPEKNLHEVNKPSPAAHGVLNKTTTLPSEQQSKEPLLENSCEAVDRLQLPKEVLSDRQKMGRKSLSIRLKDISKWALPRHKDVHKKAQLGGVIADKNITSQSLGTVSCEVSDRALISEMERNEAEIEVKGMSVPSDAQTEHLSEGDSATKSPSFSEKEIQERTLDIERISLPKESPEAKSSNSDRNEVQQSTYNVVVEGIAGLNEHLLKESPETQCISSDKKEVQLRNSDKGMSGSTEHLLKESLEIQSIRSDKNEVQLRNSDGNAEGIGGRSVQNDHVSKGGSEARCITSDSNEVQQGTSDTVIENMAVPKVLNEHLSREITKIKAVISDKNEVQQGTSDVTDCSTELGLVISSVVGGFTGGPSYDEEPTELNDEISDSGHFSLSDSENILRLPVSEGESNLEYDEETSANFLGTVTVKHDEAERSYEEDRCQDIIKTEANDRIPEESTEQSKNNQNVGYSNSDTDSDLPSFYSYLSAGSTLRSTSSKDPMSSVIQEVRQMAESGAGPHPGRQVKRKGKKGKQRHLTRRKKTNMAKKVVPPPIVYEDIDELPDIKHHIVIQDYSTVENQTVIGNKEVIDFQKRGEQVPDFSNIAIKQEPVDDTPVYLPLMKKCSIVLQNIHSGEPHLQKLGNKQPQSKKRKIASLVKANVKPKDHRTGKKSKDALEVKGSIEAGSACAMKTTDQIIKSEPSYDEASTSAYSDGGETALESEDDECNLKVLKNSIVHSSKPLAQASTFSENVVLANQSYPTDEKISSNQVQPSDRHLYKANVDIRYPLVGNNQGIVSEVFNSESKKVSEINENIQDTHQTGNVEPNNLTDMPHQQKCMSDKQNNELDHNILGTIGRDNRLDQTAAMDDTADRAKLDNQESPEVAASITEPQVPNNVHTNDCQPDEKAEPSADQLKNLKSPEVAASVSGQQVQYNVHTNDCQHDEKAEPPADKLNDQESPEVAVFFSGQEIPSNVKTTECQSDINEETSADHVNNQKSAEVAVSLSGQQVPNDVQKSDCHSDDNGELYAGQLNNLESPEAAVSLSGQVVLNNLRTNDCQSDENKGPAITEVRPTEELKTICDSSGSMTVPMDSLLDLNRIQDITKTGESGLKNHTTTVVDVCDDMLNPKGHEEKEYITAQDSACTQSLLSESNPKKQNSKCKRQRRQKPTGLANARGISKNQRTRKTVVKKVLPGLPDILNDGTKDGTSLLAITTTDHVIKSQLPCSKIVNNSTKTTAKTRSRGRKKVLIPNGSEDVCVKATKDQDKTVDRFQNDVEKLHLPERTHLTTHIRTCAHDTGNSLEEYDGKRQTDHPHMPSTGMETGSCNAESIGKEQGVTNVLESEDSSKSTKTVSCKRRPRKKEKKAVALKGSAERQGKAESETLCEELTKRPEQVKPAREVLDSYSTIADATKSHSEDASKIVKTVKNKRGPQRKGKKTVALIETAEGQRNRESETLSKDLVSPDGDKSLEVPGKQMHALNQVKPPREVLPLDLTIAVSTKLQDVQATISEQQNEAVSQAKSQKSLPIDDSIETTNKGIQKGNNKVANSRNKKADKKQSGGKRKTHQSQELESKPGSGKVSENQDDPIQVEANTGLALVAGHDAVKAFADSGKQSQISNQVEHTQKEVSIGSSTTVSASEDHTSTNVLALGHEQPLKVEKARRSKGIKLVKIAPAKKVAKSRINKQRNKKDNKRRLIPEGVESKRLCEKAIKTSDETDSKNQAEPLTESVSLEHKHLTTDHLTLPTNKSTTLKKRSGGKQRLITHKRKFEFENVSETPKKNRDDRTTDNQDSGVTASVSTGHEAMATDLVPTAHNADEYISESGMQGTRSNQLKPLNNELDIGTSVAESTSQEATVVNSLSSGCEQQLKVTNPPIRKLLETGLKGFKTYKVTKRSTKKCIGEKHKILTLGGPETIRDKLIKKLKFEHIAVESKNNNKTKGVKTCFVCLKRLDDKIIESAHNGSIDCRLLSPVSMKPPPPKWSEQKHEKNSIETQGLINSMAESTHSPASSVDHAPPDLTFEEECVVEIDSLHMEVSDNSQIPDQSIAEVTPTYHESILEMLQRQVLENHSIIVQDDGENSLVRDRAAPSEDDSMMPPLSPKAKRVHGQTDKQSPLWGYLAEVGHRKRKL